MSTKQGRPYTCGLDAAVDLIGGKWKALILWELHLQERRFGELKRLVSGISDKMLSRHLREMEADGIVYRRAHDDVPPRVDYSLTPFGRSLNEALLPLGLWGEEHLPRIEALRRH